jgi:single-strand DNA-binding protein
MSDINVVTLTGRLVRNPLLRNASTGTTMGFFTIASNHHFRDKTGAWQEEVAFTPCVAFGRSAESLAQRQKGEMLLVSGRLRTESWTKDDTRQTQLALICDSVRFFSSAHPTSSTETEMAAKPDLAAEVKAAVPF